MSDPLAEVLKRFTPDATGLGRDALLFRAGQASARRNRGWVALAGTLALSQALTLMLLLWPRGAPPTPPAVGPASPLVAEAPAPAASVEASELFALRRQLEGEGDLPAPAPSGSLVPDAPPLRAFASPQLLYAD